MKNLGTWLVCTKSLQSCLALCNPVDCIPPGSSVHGILQARILGQVAMPSSRGTSQTRDGTCVSWVSCNGSGLFTTSPTIGNEGLMDINKTHPSERECPCVSGARRMAGLFHQLWKIRSPKWFDWTETLDLLSQCFFLQVAAAAAAAKSLQSCPTLCNPIDGSPPGSSFRLDVS